MEQNPIKTGPDQDSGTKAAVCKPASKSAKTIRIISTLALLVGVSITIVLIVHHNFSAVMAALSKVGLGLAIVLVIQFMTYGVNGLAWSALYRARNARETRLLIILRWIRESINYLLPVARLGGEVVAVRLFARRGRDLNTAAAGVVVDKTMEALGLFCFAVIGVIILTEELREEGGNWNVEHWALIGLAVTFMVFALFIVAQRLGLLRVIDKAVEKLSDKCSENERSSEAGIHDIVWSIYANRSRLAYSLGLHVFAWFLGALQIWAALLYMGVKITFAGAFVIESLVQVICAAAFVMPAALGAQEAAYMSIGLWLFGINPAIGLALSLIQRIKDVVSGIAGLIVWQWFEGHHLWQLLKGKRHKGSRATPKRSQ